MESGEDANSDSSLPTQPVELSHRRSLVSRLLRLTPLFVFGIVIVLAINGAVKGNAASTNTSSGAHGSASNKEYLNDVVVKGPRTPAASNRDSAAAATNLLSRTELKGSNRASGSATVRLPSRSRSRSSSREPSDSRSRRPLPSRTRTRTQQPTAAEEEGEATDEPQHHDEDFSDLERAHEAKGGEDDGSHTHDHESEDETSLKHDGDVAATDRVIFRPTAWERFQFKMKCFTKGHWEYNPSIAHSGPRLSNPSGHGYSNKDDGMNYQWDTSHGGEGGANEGCSPFPRFNRNEFCRLLNGRSVFILGDSLSRQFHVALQDLAQKIKGTGKQQLCTGNGRGKPCPGHTICGGSSSWPSSRMLYRRSDHLQLGIKKFRWANNAIHEPWQGLFSRNPFDIVIVNTGAHYQSDADYVKHWRGLLRYFRDNHPQSLVIARNTPPGHKNCASAKGPLEAPQDPDGLPYNWGKFGHQNRLLRDMVTREFPGVIYLDVATATALRPDMHRLGSHGKDCLHYTEPRGPIDHWVRMLSATLYLVDALADERGVAANLRQLRAGQSPADSEGRDSQRPDGWDGGLRTALPQPQESVSSEPVVDGQGSSSSNLAQQQHGARDSAERTDLELRRSHVGGVGTFYYAQPQRLSGDENG